MEQEWDEVLMKDDLETQAIDVEELEMHEEPIHSDSTSPEVPHEEPPSGSIMDDIANEPGRMTWSFVFGVLLLTFILL